MSILRTPVDFFKKQEDYYKKYIDDTQQKNPFSPVSDIVYNLLLDDIVMIRLTPGYQLKERSISEAMAISRTPVRAAINRLVMERFLVKKGHGTYVAGYTKAEIDDLMFTRRALEAAAARQVTERMTPEKAKKLSKLAVLCDKADPPEMTAAFYRYDQSFHIYLFECTENHFLQASYAQIIRRIELIRNYMSTFTHENMRKIVGKHEHTKMCRILCLGMPDVSEAFMKQHISSLQNICIIDPSELN
jgi:DNA-binding GntR family transcriptional regulator